mgnify:CR=1 FL=1
MIVAVASGKGGTGKTTVATNLALVSDGVQFLDCDVEEPNAHLFLRPQIGRRTPVGIPVPQVDEFKCTQCGKCAEACEFNAIVVIREKVLVFPELCHGCGACSYVCPAGAISEVEREIGVVEDGTAHGMEFVQGILHVGEPMATPLIRWEKRLVKPEKTVIVDCSPGTSCPVIEAVRGSDFCLLVTEPTPFGLHDLRLAVEMVRTLAIPMGVVINCADLGDSGVREYCRREGIPVLLEIPLDRRIATAYSRGVPIVEALPEYEAKFRELFQRIGDMVV